ncbi:MAG: hypothetical protein H7246_23365 [Phycisphaerae bacterium]|nr:hypothetical protein [Saprospiraceae bacterium]
MNRTSIVFLNFLLISILNANAQSVNIGARGESRESELLQSDPYSDNRYYKARTFSLKKGQGVLFTMKSTEFKPFIVLAAGVGSSVPGKLDESGLVSRIAYIAESDTTFYLVHTSAEENKTGKYSFDYKILEAPQLYFDDNFSNCDRLYYLINQWFMDWELIPQHTEKHADINDPKAALIESITTKITYKKFNEAIINNGYEEVLYSAPIDSNGASRQYYDNIRNEITKCLSPGEWVFTSEFKKSNPLYVFDSDITTFILREEGKKYPCFKIILKKPVLTSLSKTTADYYYQVLLRF